MNTSSNCRTPYLHTTVEVNVPIKTVSTGKRYYYFKLADGIHPTEELNLKFLKAIDEIQKDVQITTQVTILTMNPKDFADINNYIHVSYTKHLSTLSINLWIFFLHNFVQ